MTPLSKKEVSKLIVEFTTSELNLQKGKITPEYLFKDLNIKHLDLLKLMILFEYIFKIRVTTKVYSNFKTLQDVINYIWNSLL